MEAAVEEVKRCIRNNWSVLVVGKWGFGKTRLLRSLGGVYVSADSPKRMLDAIAKKVGVKPARSTAGTLSALRPALRNKVLLVDNCHTLTKIGLRAISKLGTTFVATSNKRIFLPYRVIVKLKRRSFDELVQIAKSMCELSDKEARAIARRANGVPGVVRTLCNDVRTAQRLGLDTLKFIDEAPLPKMRHINTYYLLLGVASVLLSIRYVLYHYKLYKIGYDFAILAYMMYSVMRFRRAIY